MIAKLSSQRVRFAHAFLVKGGAEGGATMAEGGGIAEGMTLGKAEAIVLGGVHGLQLLQKS